MYLVAAMAKNRVIGSDGVIPWHLPSDLERFRRLTMGGTLIMGRKTHDSIGRTLPGRVNLVVTRGQSVSDGALSFSSLDAALSYAQNLGRRIFIIGGETIYRQTMALADGIYLTELRRNVEGDCYFPPIDRAAFRCVRHLAFHDEEPYDFYFWRRISAVTDQSG